MTDTIIVYYSYSGNTKKIAQYLHDQMNYPLIVLEPVKQMRLRSFLKFFWGGFLALVGYCPQLKPININWDDYQNIIVAGPIWAGRMSPAVKSFLTSLQFSNKNIYYLYTHEGGDKTVLPTIEKIINASNVLKSTCSCRDVAKDFDQVKDEALAWAENL